jgi:hypothetical protein
MYALTGGLAFQMFNYRYEIMQMSAPVWMTVTAIIFLVLCGAFIVKHVYKERLKAVRDEHLEEINRHESKIGELYEEIALLEKYLREKGQTEILFEDAN